MNNLKPITENLFEKAIRKYLSEEKGWKITNLPKRIGEHSIDIEAFHKKWRRLYRIECKGDNKLISHPKIHNSFNNILGQISFPQCGEKCLTFTAVR